MGAPLPQDQWLGERYLPAGVQEWCYRFGFDRAFTDVALDQWIATPFLSLFRWFDRLEHTATDRMSNEPSRESDQVELHPEAPGRAA